MCLCERELTVKNKEIYCQPALNIYSFEQKNILHKDKSFKAENEWLVLHLTPDLFGPCLLCVSSSFLVSLQWEALSKVDTHLTWMSNAMWVDHRVCKYVRYFLHFVLQGTRLKIGQEYISLSVLIHLLNSLIKLLSLNFLHMAWDFCIYVPLPFSEKRERGTCLRKHHLLQVTGWAVSEWRASQVCPPLPCWRSGGWALKELILPLSKKSFLAKKNC